uniref:Tetratricopeptide repeat protein n=1 Tax=Desertifilum tharense IPPAS B-1220 TaxID=1781255 RepID=A0ACD5GQB0_9CYAN
MKISNRVALVLSTLLVSGTSVTALPLVSASSPPESLENWIAQAPILAENELSEPLANQIEDRVNRILLRHALSLNALLVAFIGLFLAVAGTSLWFQFYKLRQQTDRHQQELESFQADAIAHIQEAIAQAEGVLSTIDERVVYSEQVIQQARMDSLIEMKQVADQTQAARDQIYQKLAEFLPRLTQFANTQAAAPQSAPATPEPAPAQTTSHQAFTLTAIDYLKQGDVLFLETRYPEAVNFYDKAIQTQPNFPEAWNNRGGALTKLQKYGEAIASYDRAYSTQA